MKRAKMCLKCHCIVANSITECPNCHRKHFRLVNLEANWLNIRKEEKEIL